MPLTKPQVIIKLITVDMLFTDQEKGYLFYRYGEESRGELAPILNPDKELYKKLEFVNMLFCVGIYESELLVGFIIAMVTPLPHYKGVMGATIESFYVTPECRKFGLGKRLLAVAEEKAIALGAEMSFMSAPIDSRLAKAASLFGYRPTTKVYTKKLKC